MSHPTVAAQLAAFALETPAAAIPGDVISSARTHLLDAIGCGVAAVGLEAGGQPTAVVASQRGTPEASVLGETFMVPAPLAALANGTRCHALDFDDTHEPGICHSSAVVGPAALAIGEATGSDGEEMLGAFALGSEVALRIATATADGLYAHGFHPTSVCGAFGAAAATCRLLGADAQTASNALGIVGSFAAGLLEFLSDGSETKPLHAGWAAQAGIQAARLAAAGATGPSSVIEGRFGLGVSHTAHVPDVELLCGELGRRWELMDLSLKPYPACHFAHASTWAAGELADEHKLDHRDLDEIIVRVPAEGVALVLEPAAAKVAPRTNYDAKFSLPYTAAYRLVHGHLDLNAFSERARQDPSVLALAARVRSGAPLERPASRFAGEACLVTRTGQRYEKLISHAPGSPNNPLHERWALSKFRSNAELALDSESAAGLMDALRLIDSQSLETASALLRASHPRSQR